MGFNFNSDGIVNRNGLAFARSGYAGSKAAVKKKWFEEAPYLDMAFVADFTQNRYAFTTVPVGSIAAATPAALCVKREATFEECFTFLCSSAGTARWRVGENGLLVSDVLVDKPRFDYANGIRQLRNNGQAQNLLLQSDDLSISPWASEGSPTVTANAAASPTGASNAIRVDDTSGSAIQGRQQVVTTTSGTSVYIGSIFAKADTSSIVSLRLSLSGGTTPVNGEAVFDLANGLAQWRSSTTGTSFKIEPFILGWYKITVVITDNGTGNNSLLMRVLPAFALTYTSNVNNAATGSALFWGADLIIDASQQPSSHITTTSASIIRAAESIQFGAVPAALMQRTNFGVLVEGQNLLKNAGRIIGVSGNSVVMRAVSNRLAVLAELPSQLTSGNGTDMRSTAWKAAAGFNASGRSIRRNGGTLSTDTVAQTVSRSVTFLGRDGNGTATAFGDGWFSRVMIAPDRPSDARIGELVA